MLLWDPAAKREEFPDSGAFIAGPYRIVLHSTEGASYAGARGAYRANSVSPHFTVSYEVGYLQVWQHVALNRSSTALEHRAGTVHTNRQSAIQIEVVAFAAKPVWPAGLITGVADLIGWICGQTGVKPVAAVFKPYPASYGEQNGVRFSDADWLAFNGICGHQHVPHQAHGDPGAINVAALLPVPPLAQPATVAPAHTETVPIPVHDFEEAVVKQTMVHIGPLDKDGNGWADWQPGLGRDPNIVAVVQLGPSPPDDNGYWPGQAKVNLSAQPRGGAARIVVRNGTPGDTVTAFVTVS